ncbi:MAG: helix-turn-helix transcriptional regulator [Bacillota bacterium]|nr:helix-turn-helix transcriptional regulator [Bacillota bacterium]
MQRKAKFSYEPLWETMRNRGVSTYQLTVKRDFNRGTLHNIKHGENVTLETLTELCEILDCRIEDVVRIEFYNVEE